MPTPYLTPETGADEPPVAATETITGEIIPGGESVPGSGEIIPGEIVADDIVPTLSLLLPAAPAERRNRQTNPALAYLASLAATGRRTMKLRLEQIAYMLTGQRNLRAVPWEQLHFVHVDALRSRLAESELSPASVNATLYALRGVAKAAWNMEMMSAEDYARIRNVPPLRGSRLPAGRSLASGELKVLLDACCADDSLAGVRDAALIAVLYCGGLRRAEIAGLDVADIEIASGALKVRGKGNKERLVYIVGGAAEALLDWLTWRGESIVETPALFCPILKNGSLQARRMTDQAIYNALQKRALQAGVLHFSPHDLRRTFVGDLLDRGVDIVTVQHLAGHANVSTTARYDRRGEAVKSKAAHTLHVPYHRRTPK